MSDRKVILFKLGLFPTGARLDFMLPRLEEMSVSLNAPFLYLENSPGQRAGRSAGENPTAGEAVPSTADRAQ